MFGRDSQQKCMYSLAVTLQLAMERFLSVELRIRSSCYWRALVFFFPRFPDFEFTPAFLVGYKAVGIEAPRIIQSAFLGRRRVLSMCELRACHCVCQFATFLIVHFTGSSRRY